MIKRMICILLMSVFLVSNLPAVASNSESEGLQITDVLVKSGENGTYVPNRYKSSNDGLDVGAPAWIDRQYRITKLPRDLIGCGYIIPSRDDVTNYSLFSNEKTDDWVTFNINKSATIYVVDYYRANEQPAKWLRDQEWEYYESGEFLVNAGASVETGTVSKRIFHKHFDVPEGQLLNIKIGGYDRVPYDNYTVVIKPDDLKPKTNFTFTEEEYASGTWDTDVVSQLGDAVCMTLGSSFAYVNGVKTRIDENYEITPIKKADVLYFPLRFIVESLGGEVKWNSENNSTVIILNGKNYDFLPGSNLAGNISLSAPVIMEKGKTWIPIETIEKVFGYNLTLSEFNTAIIKKNDEAISSELIEKTEAVFLTDPRDITLRAKYIKPGDEILIRDGIHFNGNFYVNAHGEEGNMIVVKPQTPGGVVFKGDWLFEFTGSYIEIRDFYFDEVRNIGKNMMTLHGFSYGRLTNCYFYKCGSTESGGYAMISVSYKSQHNRFDHNTFERNQTMGIAINQEDGHPDNIQNNYNTLDHNYIVDIRRDTEEWGSGSSMESFQIGIGNRFQPLNTTVEYNLWESCIGDGNEILGNKSSENVYRYNTFLNNRAGHWQIRTGDKITLDRNYFINSNIGFLVYGGGHTLTNNYFYNIDEEIIRVSTGNFAKKTLYYKEVYDTIIANNTFYRAKNSGIMFGTMYYGVSQKYTYAPKDTKLMNNLFVMDRGEVITDYASVDTIYDNNLAVLNGAAKIGVNTDGIKTVSADEVEFDYVNGVYVPKDNPQINDAGKFDEKIKVADKYSELYGKETNDIGVNMARKAAEEIGPLTVDDVGPTERWWVEKLRYTPCKDFDPIPNEEPVSYTPSATAISVALNEKFNVHALVGYGKFKNGTRYMIPCDDVSYEIKDGKDIFELKDGYLTASKSGKGVLTASYRNKSVDISVTTVDLWNSSGGKGYSKTFDTEEEQKSLFAINGEWRFDGGKVITDNKIKGKANIVDLSTYLEGDYSFSVDVKVNDNGTTGGYSTDAILIFGYKNNPDAEYYAVNIGSNTHYRNGIYRNDGYYLPNIDGNLFNFVEQGKTHRLELRRRENVVSVLIDGKLALVYQKDYNFDGCIGFGTWQNAVEFDNLEVKPLEEIKVEQIKPLDISMRQTDEYGAEIKYNAIDGVIYRIYRNGMWLTDTTENVFSDDTMESGGQFRYKIDAIDENATIIASEEFVFELQEVPPDDVFYISDVMYRSAPGGEYEPGVYYGYNKGVESNWVFHDYNYTYSNLPEKFHGSAYIQVPNVFRSHPLASSPDCNDFLKFTLNNKSATVYVIFHHSAGQAFPGWLLNDNWRQKPLEFTHRNGQFKSSAVYMKKFNVKPGGSKTVTLGGFGCVPYRVYSIIIKVDE